MEAARERPGGVARLAGELDAEQFPLDARRSPAMIDRILGEAGPEIGRVREAIDATGERVDPRQIMQRLEGLAAQEGRAPIGGQERSQALRNFAARFEPLAEEGMSFGDAHQQRRTIDDMITRFSPDPNLSSVAGQRQQLRQYVSDAMGDTAQRAGLGDEWAGANRRYSLGAFMDEYGRGGERLNAQGGIGGAISRAGGMLQAAGGNPMGAAQMFAGPAVQQEMRMRVPGLQVRTLRRLIPAMRSAGPALQRAARLLESVQQRGEPAVAAAHYLLSRRSPEYRLMIENASDEGQEE
jgi:hypothetical protein